MDGEGNEERQNKEMKKEWAVTKNNKLGCVMSCAGNLACVIGITPNLSSPHNLCGELKFGVVMFFKEVW